jgi:hypothetical protein
MSKQQLIVVLIPFVMLILVKVTCETLSPFNSEKFNSVVWKQSFDPDFDTIENPRGPMTDDLIKNHLRPGMSLDSVYQMLGPPDKVEGTDTLQYYLGYWSGFGMDPDILQLELRQGELIRVYRYQS